MHLELEMLLREVALTRDECKALTSAAHRLAEAADRAGCDSLEETARNVEEQSVRMGRCAERVQERIQCLICDGSRKFS